eukprot:11151193-Alexandrium_andersonii.AAC.1
MRSRPESVGANSLAAEMVAVGAACLHNSPGTKERQRNAAKAAALNSMDLLGTAFFAFALAVPCSGDAEGVSKALYAGPGEGVQLNARQKCRGDSKAADRNGALAAALAALPEFPSSP